MCGLALAGWLLGAFCDQRPDRRWQRPLENFSNPIFCFVYSWAGSPARCLRVLSDFELESITETAMQVFDMARAHAVHAKKDYLQLIAENDALEEEIVNAECVVFSVFSVSVYVYV